MCTLNIAEYSRRINLERQTLARMENDKAFAVLRTRTYILKPQVLLSLPISHLDAVALSLFVQTQPGLCKSALKLL